MYCLWKLHKNSSTRLQGTSFSDAESRDVEDTTVNVWEDNWDDDAKEDDFANQLRLEQFLCLYLWWCLVLGWRGRTKSNLL